MNLSEYEALNPRDFTRSVACHFDWIEGTNWWDPEWNDPELVVTMVFQHKENKKSHLYIRFTGVANIKIGSRKGINYNGGLGLMYIKDIRYKQWLWNFRVSESEAEGFQFLCVDFDAYVESRV
jgi:hypothetical protein